MVKLARWRGKEPLLDPFCGSGTIAIEAAMIATRRAPGLMRAFDADKWACIDTNVWRQAREDALEQMDGAARFDIAGSDLDPDCVALSQENAKKAGVLHTIRFTQADACKLDYRKKGTLFANPPYGERLLDMESAQKLYASFGRAVGHSPMKQYILSSDIAFERFFGKKADKRRKLYNGMIKCDLYMYFKHSPRPSAKTSELSQNGLTKNS